MKKQYFTILWLIILGLTLTAQNAPQATRGQDAATPSVAPANMGNLAVHFTGRLDKNQLLDVTITAKGASASSDSVGVHVLSVVQKGDGYLVGYGVSGGSIVMMQNGSANSTHSVTPHPSQVTGVVFLEPGKPLHAAMSADNDVTLTLTELPQ